MNKLIIPIIAVLILAAGIGAYFVLQTPGFPQPPMEPQPTANKCPQIMPPSPILKEQCEKDGGKLEPKKNEQGCVIGYECEKEVSTPSPTPAPSMTTPPTISTLSLLKKVEIVNGARPEITVTKDRVFFVYLDPSTTGNSYKVKIYDKDLISEIASKTIVTKSSEYGQPTDMRLVSDETNLYAFYETLDRYKTYLRAAKYTLDDNFERVAYHGPIAQSTMFKAAKSGDEKLDDPAPMLQGDNLYVMTRFKSTLAKEGESRYKLYKFDKNLNKKSEFELDFRLSKNSQDQLNTDQRFRDDS